MSYPMGAAPSIATSGQLDFNMRHGSCVWLLKDKQANKCGRQKPEVTAKLLQDRTRGLYSSEKDLPRFIDTKEHGIQEKLLNLFSITRNS